MEKTRRAGYIAVVVIAVILFLFSNLVTKSSGSVQLGGVLESGFTSGGGGGGSANGGGGVDRTPTSPEPQPPSPQSPQPSPPPTGDILITKAGFEPQVYVVEAGTEVTWANTTERQCTIGTGPRGANLDVILPFEAEVIQPGGTFSWTAPKEPTVEGANDVGYYYGCTENEDGLDVAKLTINFSTS